YRDKFPPPPFDFSNRLLQRFGALLPVLFAPTRLRVFRRLPSRGLTKRPIERRAEDSYARGPARDHCRSWGSARPAGPRMEGQAPAYFDRELGDRRVVLFDGAVVRIEQALFADSYEVVEGDLEG